METANTISFRDNMAGNFGDVLRSSAIFYYTYSPKIQTTISFLNYWKYKRDLDVAVVASVREMTGQLLFRQRLEFKDGEVQNFRPEIPNRNSFEGSVEIEVFSTKNMAIPYAAVIGAYKTSTGISLVHSYGRTYSNHEIEENRTIMKGEEACWSLRDTAERRSFCIIHNGQAPHPAQRVSLQISNAAAQHKSVAFELPALAPYQTIKLIPGEKIEGLASFLDGKDGFAKMSFHLNAFTRMLVGNEAIDGSDLQVTHSNFNYASQLTDHLDQQEDEGFMRIPECGINHRQMLVYPDADPGEYVIKWKKENYIFSSNEAKTFQIEESSEQIFTFTKTNSLLPTRLVTAIVLKRSPERIPNECSLGIITKLQPPKRLWWGSCVVSSDLNSKLIIHDLPEVFKGMPLDEKFSVRLFSSKKHHFIERHYDQKDLKLFSSGVSFTEIFPQAKDFLGSDFGYYTLFSNYGGLTSYSLIENQHYSVCLEHGF